MLTIHRRTLNVPPWASLAPWRGPTWLACFGVLPQHKIKRVLFILINTYPRTRLQLVKILATQLTVIFKAGNIEKHIAVSGHISVLFLNQGFNQCNDFVHVGGNARLDIRLSQVKCGKVFVHITNKALS